MTTEAPDTVEVFPGRNGQYYWRWRDAHNGQIVAVGGEGYVSERNAIDQVAKFTRNGQAATLKVLEEAPADAQPHTLTPPNTDLSGEPA